MAVSQENIGQRVQIVPPFSGQHQGILEGIEDHPSGTGMMSYKVRVGDSVQTLLDWELIPLAEGEEPDMSRVPTASLPKGGKNPASKRGGKKADAAAAADGAETAAAAPARTPKAKHACACGMCDKETFGSFAPGHDAKAHSYLDSVVAGKNSKDGIPETLKDYVRSHPAWLEKYGALL